VENEENVVTIVKITANMQIYVRTYRQMSSRRKINDNGGNVKGGKCARKRAKR
jgi:hypothetical protein